MSAISTENPYFQNESRAPYEIGVLFKQLSQFSRKSKQRNEIIKAIIRHADTAQLTLLCGLESIGRLLYHAASNDDAGQIAPATLIDLGQLIRHLAVEAQFVLDMEDVLSEEIGR